MFAVNVMVSDWLLNLPEDGAFLGWTLMELSFYVTLACLAVLMLGSVLERLPKPARLAAFAVIALLAAAGFAYAEDPAQIYYCPKIVWILGMPFCWDFEW